MLLTLKFFFNCSGLHFGTRNLFVQTANNIVLKQKIYFDNEDYDEKAEDDLIIQPESCSIFNIRSYAKTFFTELGYRIDTCVEMQL